MPVGNNGSQEGVGNFSKLIARGDVSRDQTPSHHQHQHQHHQQHKRNRQQDYDEDEGGNSFHGGSGSYRNDRGDRSRGITSRPQHLQYDQSEPYGYHEPNVTRNTGPAFIGSNINGGRGGHPDVQYRHDRGRGESEYGDGNGEGSSRRSSNVVSATERSVHRPPKRQKSSLAESEDDDLSSSDEDTDPKVLKLRVKDPRYAKMIDLTRFHWCRYWCLATDDGFHNQSEEDNNETVHRLVEEIVLTAYGRNANLKRNKSFKALAVDRVKRWSRDWQRTVISDIKVHVTKELNNHQELRDATEDMETFISFLGSLCGSPTFRLVFKPIYPYVNWGKVFNDARLKSFYITCYTYFAWIAHEDIKAKARAQLLRANAESAGSNNDSTLATAAQVAAREKLRKEKEAEDELTLYEKFRLIGRIVDFETLTKNDIPYQLPTNSARGKRNNPKKKTHATNFIGQLKAIGSSRSSLGNATASPPLEGNGTTLQLAAPEQPRSVTPLSPPVSGRGGVVDSGFGTATPAHATQNARNHDGIAIDKESRKNGKQPQQQSQQSPPQPRSLRTRKTAATEVEQQIEGGYGSAEVESEDEDLDDTDYQDFNKTPYDHRAQPTDEVDEDEIDEDYEFEG